MRAYLRHPSGLPIELSREPGANSLPELRNIGRGGLCCCTEELFYTGEPVRVHINLVVPEFESLARVAWCHQQAGQFEVGLQFLTEQDAFAARMVEQICHIEHYREEVMRREGRSLSAEAAAREWIHKYAASFPTSSGSH